MTIGVIGAMPEEVALLARDLEGARPERRGARDYLRGRLHGRDVVVVFSGWGKVASASTATTLIEVFGVEAVVFTGVAGALAADLAVGDVVIGTELLQHDLDASAAATAGDSMASTRPSKQVVPTVTNTRTMLPPNGHSGGLRAGRARKHSRPLARSPQR